MKATVELQRLFHELVRQEAERFGWTTNQVRFFFMQCAVVGLYNDAPDRVPALLQELGRQVDFLDTIEKHRLAPGGNG